MKFMVEVKIRSMRMIFEPNWPYGVSKLSTEIDLRCMKEQFNIDYCIIRPHNVYGIQQKTYGTGIEMYWEYG